MSNERIARFVPALDYDQDTDTVKSSLFAHAGTIGMSTTRLAHANDERLQAQLQSKPYVGFVTGECRAIRQLFFEGERCFAVYDTALDDNIAHADVCQAIFRPRSVRSDLRRRLQLLFTATPVRA
jgi:hypothetical protein